MDLGYAVVKGIVQGLAEFLPISSTAHLTFTNTLFQIFHWQSPLRPGEDEFFDIMLHLGTLLAVVIYFREDLMTILGVWLGRERADAKDPQSGLLLKKLPIFIAVSMMTTICWILFLLKGSGILFSKLHWATAQVENLSDYYFAHPIWVTIHLMLTGCLLFFCERSSQHGNRKSGEQFSMRNALAIGFMQGCAGVFHGISRSGSTICGGLFTGLDRITATRYTFLLSIPTFLMAAVYETVKLSKTGIILSLNWPVMLVGVVFSAVVGYFCVKYLIQYVATHSLYGFAVYCWIAAIIMMVLFLNTSHVVVAG